MGGGGSKQEMQSDIVTNLISTVCTNVTQNCTQVIRLKQEFRVGNLSGGSSISGVNMEQALGVEMKCDMNAQALSKLHDSIANELKASTSQTQQAVLGALNAMSGERNSILTTTNIKTQLKKEINNFSESGYKNHMNNLKKHINKYAPYSN